MTATTETTKRSHKKKKDSARPKTVKLELECELSDKDKLERATQLLEALQAKDLLVVAKSNQAADINAEIKLAQKRVTELTKIGRSGKELRDVECVEEFDYRVQKVTVRRADTREVVQERAMTLDERQAVLPGLEGKPPKKGGPLTASIGEHLEADGTESDATAPELAGAIEEDGAGAPRSNRKKRKGN